MLGGKATLPAMSAAKVALYQAMRAQDVRKAELARRLGVHLPQVDRLLDLRHASRFDQIDSALRALGKDDHA
jgi:antitoxin HicB